MMNFFIIIYIKRFEPFIYKSDKNEKVKNFKGNNFK
jgi:hypothetical protein